MKRYKVIEPAHWRADWIANGGDPEQCPTYTITYPTLESRKLPRDQWVWKEVVAGSVVSDIPEISIASLLEQGIIVEVGRPAAAKGEA